MALPVNQMTEDREWVPYNKRNDFVQMQFLKQQRQAGYNPQRIGVVLATVNQYSDPPHYTKIEYTRKDVAVATVYRKKIINVFGSEDWRYYYVCYRRYDWDTKWSYSTFTNLSKYKSKLGNMLNEEVFLAIRKHNQNTTDRTIGISSIVLGIFTKEMNEKRQDPVIWYSRAHEVMEFTINNNTRFEPPWHERSFAFPKDLFTLEDVFAST